MSDYVFGQVTAKFKKIQFSECKAGDIVFYQVDSRRKQKIDDVYGPFVVIDIETCRLRNKNGVELNLNPHILKFLSFEELV